MTTTRKAIIAVMIISSVLLLQSMTPPLFAYIMASYSEVAPGTAYLVLTLPALVGIVSAFAFGPLAMKFNIKWLTVIVVSCAAIYFAIFSFVGSGGPFSLLLVAAGIVGIVQGVAFSLTGTIIGMYVEEEKRATMVAISGAVLNSGAAIFNIAGGVIAAGNGGANWPQAYYMGIIIIPAIILFIFFMPKAPDAPAAGAEGAPGGAAEAAPKKAISVRGILIILFGFLVFTCNASFLLNVGVYVVDYLQIGTSAEAGLANSLFTILGIVAGLTFALWIRILKQWIVVLGIFVTAAGLFVLVFFNSSIVGIFLGSCLMGFGFNVANPFIIAQLIGEAAPRFVPLAMGLLMGAMNLGFFFAMDMLGFLAHLFSDGNLQDILLVGGIGMAVAAILTIPLFGMHKGPKPQN